MVRMLLALGLIISSTTLAQAQRGPISVYSRISDCASHQLTGEPVWEMACLAYENWSIFIHSTEHGSAIAYAYDGSERTAFIQPPRMRLYGSFNDTIEWRRNGGGAFASIHRYISTGPAADADVPHAGDETVRHDLLLITALNPGQHPVACPVAYIDASQIADANEAARSIAEAWAYHDECDGQPPRLLSSQDEIEDILSGAYAQPDKDVKSHHTR